MSTSFKVVVPISSRNAEVAAALLQQTYMVAVQSLDSPGVANQIRLVCLAHNTSLSFEPFVGAAALSALFGIRKKRPTAIAFARALVACALSISEEVFVQHVDEAEEVSEPDAQTVSFLDFPWAPFARKHLRLRVLAEKPWFRVGPVEVRLVNRLTTDSGQLATNYFQTLWISAASEGVAEWFATAHVKMRGGLVIDRGRTVTEDPPPDLPVTLGFIVCSGRAYFGSDGN